jgi:hypothetical protein
VSGVQEGQADQLVAGHAAQWRHQVLARSRLGILEVAEQAKAGLLERPDCRMIRGRRPEAREAHAFGTQSRNEQAQRSRPHPAAQKPRLADQDVDIHETRGELRETCRFQLGGRWPLPAQVADGFAVGVDHGL